jgi:hypothetical protein
MAQRDLVNIINPVQSLAPATRTASANGAAVSVGGYYSAAVVFTAGTISDGAHTPKVQESKDGTTWADVPTERLQGALENLASNSVQKVGVLGDSDYITHLRAVVTVSGAVSGGVVGANVVLGHPAKG